MQQWIKSVKAQYENVSGTALGRDTDTPGFQSQPRNKSECLKPLKCFNKMSKNIEEQKKNLNTNTVIVIH